MSQDLLTVHISTSAMLQERSIEHSHWFKAMLQIGVNGEVEIIEEGKKRRKEMRKEHKEIHIKYLYHQLISATVMKENVMH